MTRRHALRVDWPRVFGDFAYLGLTGDALTQRVGLRMPLVLRIAEGRATPPALSAPRVRDLWVHLTGKPAEFLPMVEGTAAATPPAPIPNLTSNAEPEPSMAELQAITMVWAQIRRN